MSVESTSPSRPTAKQWVFGFEEGSAEMRGLLGGKGANLAEMTHVLGSARVPGGFTITTEACVEYMRPTGAFRRASTKRSPRPSLASRGRGPAVRWRARSVAALRPLGRPCLDARDARHGPQSGPERRSVEALSEASGNPRFAWDSFRRLVQMFSDVVRGVPAESFEDELAKAREATDRPSMPTSTRTLFGSSPSAFWPSSPSTRASPFPRTRGSSCGVPSRRSSVPGTTIAHRLPALRGNPG